jgi:ribonuclease BN (tRNA processing enzyme)
MGRMGDLTFVGTGEAFDPALTNTSLLYRGASTVLFDCGYSVPHALWAISRDPDLLDAIYVTHIHADHAFGLPSLLLPMRIEGRTRPLTVVGGPGTDRWLWRLLRLAYPGAFEKLKFPLEFAIVSPRRPVEHGGLLFEVARSEHPVRNLSVRVTDAGRSFAFSGDGVPTPATERLYRGVDLLVHEAFWLEGEGHGHTSAEDVIAMAQSGGAGRVALLHVAKELKAAVGERVSRHDGSPFVFVPRPGDTVEV